MKELFILDACALIALLRKEVGAEIVTDIFKKALENSCLIIMNKLNLLEVYYDTYRSESVEKADGMLGIVARLPIYIKSEISDEVLREAGRLKAEYKISIADSVAVAETSISGGALLTSDHHEFDIIEKSENINFHWIR